MYENLNDLPDTLRDTLPEEAQRIYLDAYKRAYEDYEEFRGGEAGREAVAHRDAMHAVKQEYVHKSDSGKWYRKGEEPAEDKEDEDEGLLDSLRDMV